MFEGVKVTITALALREMTPEQLKALQENVLAEGRWETAHSVRVILDFGTLMVTPLDKDGISMIHLGIEPDGYTHS